ncbi:MAG TPA: hypothetical protein DEO32_05050 [Ruminococcaceae bacterium]|nr:hypothetical protein [Oscillospiraceae bacterium]
MKLKSLVACLLLSAITLASCANSGAFSDSEIISSGQKREKTAAETFNYADGAIEPPKGYNTYSNAAQGLGFKLFRAKYEEHGGKSFAFSPANTLLQLSLLANGASGDAKNEILLNLGGLTAEDVNTCSSYFKSRMEEVAKPKKNEQEDENKPFEIPHTSLFNNVFVNNGNEITKAFLQADAEYYGINIIRTDFSSNDFSEKQKKLFENYTGSSVDYDKKSNLYTTSSLSVSDSWLSELTDAGSDGYITSEESYLSTDKAEGVIKYAKSNPLKFLAVKPKGKTALDDYMSVFDVNEYNALLNSQDIKNAVAAKLPQFTIDSGEKAKPLSPLLRKSGFYMLFSDDARFKAMNIAGNLKLSEMYEFEPSLIFSGNALNTPAKIDSDLYKTEKIESKASGKKTVSFDEPFIFILLDNESGIPVMAGVYDNTK